MVRINLINPKCLADQHLIAEYNEILMLLGHVKKHPFISSRPKKFCLGAGHINFFKDKLKYLKSRHYKIAVEMKSRGFAPKIKIDLSEFPISLQKDWRPNSEDKKIIKKRLIEKINKRPDFYRYRTEKKDKEFFIKRITKG